MQSVIDDSNLGETVIADEPVVSIVVPCRNERDHIESCVRSILQQEALSGELEIIVADGMSDDGTRETLVKLAAQDQRLRIVDNPIGVTPAGMNIGIRQARGRYVAIMGAHNTYASDYLCRSIEIIEQHGADNVGGAVICDAKSPLQRAIAAAHHSPFSVGGARWHNVNYEGPADTVFGGVYRREVFGRIGLFDEELVRNQDDEFNLRLTRAGGKIWHSPKIKSWYTPRGSISALFLQYRQYGYWKVRVIQKHKLPASVRHLIPGCFVLSLIILSMASVLSASAFWVLLALAGLYSLCNLTASLLTAGRNGGALVLVLPVVFAAYHFGYGLGFLHGMWDFLILRRRPSHKYTKLSRSTVGVNSFVDADRFK
ncbi:MAG: glycosyltransferase family 2 protein [Nitrospirota bacterium]